MHYSDRTEEDIKFSTLVEYVVISNTNYVFDDAQDAPELQLKLQLIRSYTLRKTLCAVLLRIIIPPPLRFCIEWTKFVF